MGVQFSLRKVWDGWRSVRSPDNIKFTISFPTGQSFDVFASILDLVELYDLVRSKGECDTMIGTGNIIQIKSANEGVFFILDEKYKVKTSYESLEATIEQLLREVFSKIDGEPIKMPKVEREAYPRVEEVYQQIMGGS